MPKLGYKQTDIEEIPVDWQVIKLGDLDNNENKSTIDPRLYPSETFELYSIPAYYENKEPELKEGRSINSNKLVVENDTILFGKINPRNPKVWRINSKTNYRKIASLEFIPFIPNEKTTTDFIYYLLWSEPILEKSKSLTTGSTPSRERVEPKRFFELIVYLPSFAEQQKIAIILSKVDELIQKTDQVIERTQRLKKGLMHKLLTKGIGHNKFKRTPIGEIPEEWQTSTIGEECKVGSGGTPSRRIPAYFKGNIPWVKTTELNYNRITTTEESITEAALRNSSAKIYPKETFVVAMIGLEAEKTMGRCAILGINASVNQACAAIQPTGRVSELFLFYFYQTLRSRIMSLMAGTKRQNLNLELVKSIEIPILPLDEQNKITSIISRLDTTLQKESNYRTKLQNLKKGLMQNLLTGKLRIKV